MDWLLDHFQIVALIALAVGSWVKARLDSARTAQQEREAPGEMPGQGDVFGPDTGWPQPPTPAVPPPVVRAVPPPLKRHVMPVAVSALGRPPVTASPPPSQAGKVTTIGGAAATRSRVSAAQIHVQSAHARKAGLHASLRHRKAIRHAIVMREILGPPLGLR